MQLNQFKFLIAVDKYGSISKAAQELYISQSTISLSLINLEEELGMTLLNRSKRGVKLTPEGQEVLRRAYTITEALESLKEITSDEEHIVGDVRVAVNSHLGMNIITDMMLKIKQQYDGIRIFAYREYVKDVLNAMAQKTVDIAFINYNADSASDIENLLTRYRLEFHEIFRDKLTVCARKNHPLQGRAVTLDEVLNYDRVTMIYRNDGMLMQPFHPKGKTQAMVSIDDTANLRKFAMQTNGVVFLPRSEAIRSNSVYAYKLEMLDVVDLDVDVIGGWVHHNNHELLAAEACVVRMLENVCQEYITLGK